MPNRLKAPLTYPVSIEGFQPRVLETFLDAVAYLHERERQAASSDVSALIDQLMMAAASQDPDEMAQATQTLERLLTRRSW